MIKPIRGLAAAGAFAFLLLPVTAHAYSTVYVFGDSLSDAGNVYLASGGAQPAAPYFNGQYSNGATWVQDLSASLGLGLVTASLAGGNDYAFGGATTGYLVPGPTAAVPTLMQQVGLFTAAVGGVAPSSALYAVWSGANDLFAILSNGLFSGALTTAEAIVQAEGAANAEATALAALATAGAKDFVVPLLPDLGKTPTLTASGADASAAATMLSQAYNAALVAKIDAMTAGSNLSVSLIDTYSLINAAIDDPASYGFTNVTDSCYTGAYTGGGTVCTDPSQYLFWDGVHPTAAAQAMVAAAAAVPEPEALAILIIGLIGLGMLRDQRAAYLWRTRHAREKQTS